MVAFLDFKLKITPLSAQNREVYKSSTLYNNLKYVKPLRNQVLKKNGHGIHKNDSTTTKTTAKFSIF